MIKILYFGDTSLGAMGIINRDIKAVIDRDYPEIEIDLLDWSNHQNYHKFFNEVAWKDYDIIITDPNIAFIADGGWRFDLEDQPLFKSKLIPIYHSEVDIPSRDFNHGWYEGWFTTPVCAINPYIVNQIKERGEESQLLPIGVNLEKFKPFKEVKKIKKIGWVGHGFQEGEEIWKLIKRPDMFKEIGDVANIEYVTIFDKPHGPKMYEDIDAIICTSIAEGNPMAFLEAAACKIPFISTNVGIVREYDNVKTFETVDEAVAIINRFNESEDNIKEYVNNLYGEIFPEREWDNVLEKYWIPHFNNLVNKNKEKYNIESPIGKDLNLKVNPELNIEELKLKYAQDKTIVIENFLDDMSANSLYEFYVTHMPRSWWSMSYTGVNDMVGMDGLSDEYLTNTDAIMDIYKSHWKVLGEERFCYIFNRTTPHGDGCYCGHCQYLKLIETPEVLELLSYITDQPYSQLGEFFASEFTSGQFLSKHHDHKKGKLSTVYSLAKDWDPSFGGNLYILYDDWKTIEKVVPSGFNRLNIMGIPDDRGKAHFVSQVSEGVTKHRLSITGWIS